MLIAVFESTKIWFEGLLGISPRVVVWAFVQLTGKDNTATGDGNNGKDSNNYFHNPDNAKATDPVTLDKADARRRLAACKRRDFRVTPLPATWAAAAAGAAVVWLLDTLTFTLINAVTCQQLLVGYNVFRWACAGGGSVCNSTE